MLQSLLKEHLFYGKTLHRRQTQELFKKWRILGLPTKTFARENELNRETFRDWANAYRDLEGSFVRINIDENNPHQLIKTDDVTMNLLNDEQITKKHITFLGLIIL